MIKKILTVLSFISLLFISPTSALAAVDQIDNFSSQITINQDTSLTIIETLDYQTDIYKHGIYRYIPITYNKDGLKERLMVDQIRVTDEEGDKIPFSKTYDSKNLTLKIGDPDKTFTGEQTYVISYDVEKAINSFDDHDELYWDITGEGWQIPILNSQAEIVSEFAQINQVACYSGAFGSDDGLCQQQFDSNKAIFIYDQQIEYGDNMTVVVGLNKDNQLLFPTPTDNFISWLKHNWSIFLIPLPLLAMTIFWLKKGRDLQFVSANVFNMDSKQPTKFKPLTGQREPFVYEPLKDLTPGEAGALMDEKVDNQDIVAEILELARKKYLKIELIEKKKLLGKSRDYQMSKLKNADNKLPEVQKYLQQKLFAKKDVVTVSGLKGSFYTTMNTAGQMLDKSLVKKGLYSSTPNVARGKGFLLTSLSLAGVFALIIWQLIPFQIFWPIPLLMLQLPICFLLAYQMPQKTAVGTNLALQAKGLRKSIKYGKWREEVKEKNLFVEEVLPFAVSLGVVTQLAKQMKDLNIQPPDYLHSANMTTWSTSQFVSGFSQEMASSLSYNPSSSSSSGGSGFGGSSGGGGGGGGGGSW